MRTGILTLLLAGLGFYARGQETVPEKLIRANKLYEQGQLSGAIDLATDASKVSQNERDRWQAYRLLAIAYLADNQQAPALDAGRQMLALNPRYKKSSLRDPAELTRLLRDIPVLPKLCIGVSFNGGASLSFPQVTGQYNTGDFTKDYATGRGYDAELSANYYLGESWGISSGISVYRKALRCSYATPLVTASLKEQLTYLGIPLMLRYTALRGRRLRPYLEAGGYASRLMSTSATFGRSVYNGLFYVQDSTARSDQSSRPRRADWEAGIRAGLGLQYRIGQGFAHVAVNGRYSLVNLVRQGSRYGDQVLYYDYNYLDDDLRLHSLAFTVGYAFILSYRVPEKGGPTK